ncbi:MAG: beta-galactosidase [Candidatus Acidiferrales bacterium]
MSPPVSTNPSPTRELNSTHIELTGLIKIVSKFPVMLLGPAKSDRGTRDSLHNARAAGLLHYALASLLLLFGVANAWAVTPGRGTEKTLPRGVEIVQHGGYPELHVDGEPFFVHSAAFFYFRIPRDLWNSMLDRYRLLGINTIEIYIPWNWHEPREGEFDFDGHSNPRRDLRGLLRLISLKGFKLIARPGPAMLREWRHGGYPEWLLERPEYKMSPADRLEGLYPPLASLNAHDAEAAAQGWLDNAMHMSYAEKWLAAVAHELAPYSSHTVVTIMSEAPPNSRLQDVSGPLLFVQLEGIGRTNNAGPAFWCYMATLRGWFEAGGLDVPFFINSADMRVSAAGSPLEKPIAAMGQWYTPPRSPNELGRRALNDADASTIEFYAEELKTQATFPPVLIEYQAGWYSPGDDDRPPESPPGNTLLSSRLFLANGLHGLNYFPLQDTLTPAGYSVPWANQFYRWEAALGPDGDRQPRARAVARNGEFLDRWGPQLAASHKRADFGILYPLGAFPQSLLSREDIERVSSTVLRLEKLGQLDHLASEVLDPEHQPVEQLARDAVLVLPVFDPGERRFQLSEGAQNAIVEYVRRGGTLIFFPERPRGRIFDELWKEASIPSPSPEPAFAAEWKFGSGQIIESSKDFLSQIPLGYGFSEIEGQPQIEWATRVFREFLTKAGVRPAVVVDTDPGAAANLVVDQIVTNEGTVPFGGRTAGQGFLSVTNLGTEEASSVKIYTLPPKASARAAENEYVAVQITLPGHESLLLPLDQPICAQPSSGAPCEGRITAGGAEFLGSERDGKVLELTFYAPARAEVRLKLDRQPSHVNLEENRPEATWNESSGELLVEIPRGASPGFHRVLKIDMRENEAAEDKPSSDKKSAAGFTFSVANGIRLPLGENAALKSYPPLIVQPGKNTSDLLLETENSSREKTPDINVIVEGSYGGSGSFHVNPRATTLTRIKLRPADKPKSGDDIAPSPDGLSRGSLEVRAGQDRRTSPVAYLKIPEGAESHYRFDFDRDGKDEWVLENSGFRLIVSPDSGGRAIALVEKKSGQDLVSSVGAFRDNFSYTGNPVGENPERAHGRYGLFNRAYAADWLPGDAHTPLRLRYDAPDIFPDGASIEKTVQFDAPDVIRVNYRISLRAPGKPAASGAGANQGAAPGHPQSFVAVNSLQAISSGDRTTRFCWSARAGDASSSARGSDSSSAATAHCEDFVPGGETLKLSDGSTRLEVRTPGEPGLAFEWESGTMTIDRKNFSALLCLEFPPLEPGGEGSYTLRMRLLPTE